MALRICRAVFVGDKAAIFFSCGVYRVSAGLLPSIRFSYLQSHDFHTTSFLVVPGDIRCFSWEGHRSEGGVVYEGVCSGRKGEGGVVTPNLNQMLEGVLKGRRASLALAITLGTWSTH